MPTYMQLLLAQLRYIYSVLKSLLHITGSILSSICLSAILSKVFFVNGHSSLALIVALVLFIFWMNIFTYAGTALGILGTSEKKV